MSFRPTLATGDAAVMDELITLRDWLRYAVSRFEAAGLTYGHGTSTALDEAAFLILHTLRLPIDQLEPFADTRLLRAERQALSGIIEARIATRKPAPYLTNEAWIQGHSFYVDERVIVPRSYIGELLGERLAGLVDTPDEVTRVLDLCTGSGCLAILAALAFPAAEVDAVDISPDALAVARRNVDDYGLGARVRLFAGDLYDQLKGQRYDLIVTNPPYVDAAGMAELPPEYAREPALALAGGEDGLDIVKRIVAHAGRHLRPAGGLLIELGRCRPAFEAAYPLFDALWIESQASTDEIAWVTARQITGLTSHAAEKRMKTRARLER